MTVPRTSKRSRSGAAVECPHCKKKLRGGKGLKAHVAEKHTIFTPDHPPVIYGMDLAKAEGA